jgi:GMP synthase (glutamine-hydrolysing)
MNTDQLLQEVRAVVGEQHALLYERELATLPTHREVMHQVIARLPKNHKILFVDNSIPLTDEQQAKRGVASKAQHAAHAISECTTPGNANTAQRLKSMFGYEDESDSRAIVWHAPFETPVTSLDDITAIILSGSGAMVTDHATAPWMQREMAVIQEAAERKIPVLGICFGHQIMAQAMGGQVDWMVDASGERIMELGPTAATVTPEGITDPLFAEVADAEQQFTVQATHSQHVTVQPPNTNVLATNAASPIQALRYTGLPFWSLQNHPENSMILMDIRIEEMRSFLDAELFNDAVNRLTTVDTTAAKTHLFANFLTFVADYQH